MTQSFINAMGIPKVCELNKPVFKKMFLENADLDATDKKALKNDIERIRWLYTLKPSTINISKFEDANVEYPELVILQIDLSSPTRAKRIASFINKAIPYPLILLFDHNGAFAVSVVNKRINQADKTKWVIDEEWLTDWICDANPTPVQASFMADCAINHLSSLNFYACYQDMVARVIALNAATRTGVYNSANQAKTIERRTILTQIAEHERQLAQLRVSLKQETQFNRKLELNMAIKALEQAINALETQL